MKWTIGKKVGVSFSIILLLIIMMSALSIRGAFTLNSNTSTLNNEIIPEISLLNKIIGLTDRMHISMQNFLVSDEGSYKEQYTKEFEEINQQIDKSMKSYEVYVVSEQGKVNFEQFKTNLKNVVELSDEVIRLKNAGQLDQAVQKSYELMGIYETVQKNIDDLLQLLDQQSENIHEQGVASFERSVIFLIAGSVVALILTISISIFFIRAIKRPVELLSTQVKELANGNLAIEPIVIKNKDEIGQLGTDFNSMLHNLKDLISGLQGHIQTVAATSEELSASAEETSRATDQITAAMVSVSEGADEQVQGVRTSNEAILEMVSGMDHATTSVQSVFDLAVSTKDYTKNGAALMNETMQQMESIQSASDSTAGIIQSLDEKSNEISQIVGLITTIADQTNLLALNAAIEAARAGEYGKGFAVVADEVRKLAEDSSIAANQIRDVIKSVQQEVIDAVHAMEKSTNNVRDGIALVKKSEDNFQGISSMIGDVSSQTENISAIIEQLSANTISIKAQISGVATLSETSSDQAQTVAAAAEEQNATMDEISKSAYALGQLSSELQEMVQQFRL